MLIASSETSPDVLESRVELDFDGCEPASEGGLSIDFLVFLSLPFFFVFFDFFDFFLFLFLSLMGLGGAKASARATSILEVASKGRYTSEIALCKVNDVPKATHNHAIKE